MTVVSVTKDVDALTLTFVAEFAASVERVWQVWEDPRKLERWWGPPTWPATFERHDFVVGGRSRYHMTGPEGEKSRGGSSRSRRRTVSSSTTASPTTTASRCRPWSRSAAS